MLVRFLREIFGYSIVLYIILPGPIMIFYYVRLSEKRKVIKQKNINERISELLWCLKRITWARNFMGSVFLSISLFVIICLWAYTNSSISSLIEIFMIFHSFVTSLYFLTKYDWLNKASLCCLCLYTLEFIAYTSYIVLKIHKGSEFPVDFDDFYCLLFLCSAISGVFSNLIKLFYRDRLVTEVDE